MEVKSVATDLIRTDGGTQMRAELSQEVYLDYRDKWKAGVEFDPVDVFHDGSTYWLADGFHRFYGACEAKRPSIPCKVHQGTQREAILFATGANAAHGLRRTNKDKRQAVLTLLNDEEWCRWSDNRIAEQACVNQTTVSAIRRELMESINSQAAKTVDAPRIGRDGKEYPSRNPKPAPQREPGEDEPEPQHVERPAASAVTRNGNLTVAAKPYDWHTLEKGFGALARQIDDAASALGLNNQKLHRAAIAALGAALEAAKAFVTECEAVHARKK